MIKQSTEIVIVKCTETHERGRVSADGVILDEKDGIRYSEIEVVHVLKGNVNHGPSKLMSRYRPHQGEYYLVFSQFMEGAFRSYEPYKIVPLKEGFSTNAIPAEALEGKIKFLLSGRLAELDKNIRDMQAEKERLSAFVGRK
jgi:hypothetical protein